jgi:hypothetical protein
LGLPAEPGYVSLSGAVTFGFAATPRELHADPIAWYHVPESQIPGLCRRLFDEMWRWVRLRSVDKWTRLASARVPVTNRVLAPMITGTQRAHAQLSRTPNLSVRIFLPLVALRSVWNTWPTRSSTFSKRSMKSISRARWHRGFTALWRTGRPPLYETDRATAMGRLVAREVNASRVRRYAMLRRFLLSGGRNPVSPASTEGGRRLDGAATGLAGSAEAPLPTRRRQRGRPVRGVSVSAVRLTAADTNGVDDIYVLDR